MPRILVGTYFQETNDFHPNDTIYEDFGVVFGEEMLKNPGEVQAGAVNALSRRVWGQVVP